VKFPLCLAGTGRTVAVLLLSSPVWAWAADPTPAATVTMLTGRGTATADTTIRPLAKGDAVFSGEIVSSANNSFINLKFTDGGYVLLRPASRFHVEQFVDHASKPAAPPPPPPAPPPKTAATHTPAVAPVPLAAPTPAPSAAFFRLLKGGFRAVSGLVGRFNHEEYQVATPVATIGIRGTDYEAVICDAACAMDPVISSSLPPGKTAEGGLITGVFHGRIEVGDLSQCPEDSTQKSKACVELSEGQYNLTTADGSQVSLPSQPHFLNVDPIPNPRMCE